jgi:hypothetical protein
MRLWQVDALPEVPTVAAEPYGLLLAGDWRAAADAWQALGCPYERAQALAHGDNQASLEALRLLDGLGARQAAQRVRRPLGAGIPQRPEVDDCRQSGRTDRPSAELLRLLAAGRAMPTPPPPVAAGSVLHGSELGFARREGVDADLPDMGPAGPPPAGRVFSG